MLHVLFSMCTRTPHMLKYMQLTYTECLHGSMGLDFMRGVGAVAGFNNSGT